MASQGMNNLTTLIKRLEAATSRLEDIASSSQAKPSIDGTPTPTASTLSSTNGVPGSPLPTAKTEALPPAVQAMDSLIADDLKPFTDQGTSLGDTVSEQTAAFARAFKATRRVILISTKSKKPDIPSPTYMEILSEIQQEMETIHNLKENNRFSPHKNHLFMLAEGAGVCSWVTIDGKPTDYVDEILGGAQLYGNRILTEFRDKDQNQVDWVRAFVKLCGSLKSYIKQHYSSGLKWNENGISPEEALRAVKEGQPLTNGASAASSREAGAPPPPPPPPPLPQLDAPSVTQPRADTGRAEAGDMGAVFDQLNQGEAVTASLRKVDKSEMTHKNPSLRAQAPIPARSDSSSSTGRGKSPTPPVKQKPESMRTKKPPRKELDGNKWIVENYENEQSPIEIEAEKHHSILVSRCKKANLRIKGKANAIAVDNCSRVGIVVDSLVSTVEAVNCSSFQVQVLGTLPSVQLDKVDGATVYLSKESLNAEVYTSKCTSVNITLPPSSDEDDSVELPVPEQIKTIVVDGKLVNEIVKQEG